MKHVVALNWLQLPSGFCVSALLNSAQRSLRLTECSVGGAESAEKIKVISLPEFEDAETMFRIASLSIGRRDNS